MGSPSTCGFLRQRTRTPRPEGIGGPSPRQGGHSSRKETGPLIERVTGRYEQFRQAVGRARSGEWSAEEFEAFMLHVYETLTARAADCRAFIEETCYRDEAPGIAHATKSRFHFAISGRDVLLVDVKIWTAEPTGTAGGN